MPASQQASRAASPSAQPVAWDRFFQGLSPDQQSELTRLASEQGLLHTHQLPVSSNGVVPPSGGHTTTRVGEILAGNVQDLPAVRPVATPPHDTALDAGQRAAVARALSATDITLIQGLPGTGKSRVIAEILHQAAKRGERTLVLGRTAASADHLLELVERDADILTLRCLAPGETAEQLPRASRAATAPERVCELGRRGLEAARAARDTCANECAALRQLAPVWAHLREIADRLDQLTIESEGATQRLVLIAEEVEHDAVTMGFAAQSGRMLDESDAAISDALQQISKLNDECAELSRRIDELRPMADARAKGRWWTAAWWNARRHKSALQELPSCMETLERLRAAVTAAERRTNELKSERIKAEAEWSRARERRIADETERRRNALNDQLEAVRREREVLLDKWRAACAALDGRVVIPDQDGDAVRTQHDAWNEALVRKEQAHGVLKQWVALLEEANPWSTRLRHCVHVVVAPYAALANGLLDDTSHFDLLILQEAEQFSESEFASMTHLARRNVLVGEPRASGFFENIWRALHWDPGSLPYRWEQEACGLCCRLRPVKPEHRTRLEREFVADYPDIELRILTLPPSPPVLAEVVFPPSMSLADAKRYIFHELDELAVEPAGNQPHWSEEPNKATIWFTHDRLESPGTQHSALGTQRSATTVELEPGVTEILDGTESPRTLGIEFERAVGWDYQRAETWICRRLGGRALGRTARLDKAHRLHPHLAAFIAHVAYGSPRQDMGLESPNGCGPRVEFVPVPALREQVNASGGRTQGIALSRKGGAGLEIDLSDPRQRPRLPTQVLNGLPGKGVVNLTEAQAVVRWLQAQTAKRNGTLGSVGIMAMDVAQVQLMRGLLRQTPEIESVLGPVMIDTPAAFREREFSVVLLSLTRSHSHRAIAFSDGPDTLPLALTRGQSQLVIFGDAGSLARRSEWHGPIEHLDEIAAGREREMVGRLVQYVEGKGAYPAAFRLCEVAGA
jgi:hypothetical protein